MRARFISRLGNQASAVARDVNITNQPIGSAALAASRLMEHEFAAVPQFQSWYSTIEQLLFEV